MTFLAAEDFKLLLRHLSPHFKVAASYRLLNRFCRELGFPFRKKLVPEYRDFVERRMRFIENVFLDYERISSNILWGIKEGALVTVGFDPLCDLYSLRKMFYLGPRESKPLFAYDIGNVYMSKVFDVPLWAERGIITSLTENYPRIFGESKKHSEVEFPIEALSKNYSLNPVVDYEKFFSDLKSRIRRQVSSERVHELISEFSEERKKDSTYLKSVTVSSISVFVPDPLIRFGLLLTTPILIFIDGKIRRYMKKSQAKNP